MQKARGVDRPAGKDETRRERDETASHAIANPDGRHLSFGEKTVHFPAVRLMNLQPLVPWTYYFLCIMRQSLQEFLT